MPTARTKLVNGVRVDLTQEEIDTIEAEWAANASKPAPDMFREALKSNPLTTALMEELAVRTGLTQKQIEDAVRTRWENKV